MNGIYIIVDALRFDVFDDLDAATILAPNLSRLIENGLIEKVTTNAQSTQFVLPSLFSLAYPLDYGGYNEGVRLRPRTYPEQLTEAGYDTVMITNCNQMGCSLGYDRGFSRVHAAIDFSSVLTYRLEKTIGYEIARFLNSEIDKNELIPYLQRELGLMLQKMLDQYVQGDRTTWSRDHHRVNDQIGLRLPDEIALLEKDPEKVLEKLTTIPYKLYWRFLGMTSVSSSSLFWGRLRESVNWRLREILLKTGFPFFPLGYAQGLAGELVPAVAKEMAKAVKSPQAVHLHIMDVHDSRALNRPINLLYRLRYLPRVWRARSISKTKRKFWYDMTVAYVDDVLSKIFALIETHQSPKDTCILVTADHGYGGAAYARENDGDLGFRTHAEDLEVPMIVRAPEFENEDSRGSASGALIDSMGVTATYLKCMSIPAHPAFRGVAIQDGGVDLVVSENAGRGNADIVRRDLYFTLTTRTFRAMVLLSGNKLSLEKYFEFETDPFERDNLASAACLDGRDEAVFDLLVGERRELLELRGVYRAGSNRPDRIAHSG